MAKKQADPKKAQVKAAYVAKRREKLERLMDEDPVKFKLAVNFREAKELNLAANFPAFCDLKKTASAAFWESQKSKGPGVKSKDAMQKKLTRLKELEAKLRAQCAERGIKLDA